MDKIEKEIKEMREYMLEKGVYSKKDVEEICALEKQYLEECEDIAKQCEEEGYPSHGSNYDLRCGEARKFYDMEIEFIVSEYEGGEEY